MSRGHFGLGMLRSEVTSGWDWSCDTRGYFTLSLFIWCGDISYDVFILVQIICPSPTFHVRSFFVSSCSISSFLDFPLRDQTCLITTFSVAYKRMSLYFNFLKSNSVAPLALYLAPQVSRSKLSSNLAPRIRWEKRRVQYKLALLAKENIILDTFLGPKPEMVDIKLDPIYEKQ